MYILKNKSLKTNAFFSMLKTFLNIIFPLITFPYVTRILGADNIGKIDFSKSIVNYFILISSFGIAQYAVREGSRIKRSKHDYNIFLNEMYSINIISTLISYVLLLVSIFFISSLNSYIFLILILSMNLISNAFLFDWLFTIEEDFAYTAIRSIFIQIISLLLMFIFVHDKDDYIIYAFITAFSLGGSSFFNYIRVQKYTKLHLKLNKNLYKHIKPMMIFFLSNVASSIYLNSDITIIGLISGNYYVGLYSVSVKIYTIIKQLCNSLMLVSMPRLSYYIGEGRIDDCNKLLSNILNSLLLFLIPSMAGLVMLRDSLIKIIAGTGFERSSISLAILSVTLIFSVLSAFIVYGVLIPNKLEKSFLCLTILSAILNFLINLLLVPSFQEIGAAVSTLISEFCMLGLSFYVGRKYVRFEKVLINLLSSVFGGIIVILTCSLVSNILSGSIVVIIGSATLSIVSYSLFLLLTKNALFEPVIMNIKRKIFKR